MRRAQRALADFLPLIDWGSFRRRNLNKEVEVFSSSLAVFACGDSRQALVWLLRKDATGSDGLIRADAPATATVIRIPGLLPGSYRATGWDTRAGAPAWSQDVVADGAATVKVPCLKADVAIALSPTGAPAA